MGLWMPRPPRLEIPGVPLHVIQRGNNRGACFFGDVDRRFYLKCLGEASRRGGCAIHAYVLMTNHVHLLVTPTVPGAAARMLQDLGRRYVRVINTIHGRTGTLWEGRFKSSVVTTERHLLACHRYIEMNPVRAGIASTALSYPWSSHRHYAEGQSDPLISEHDCFLSLGQDPKERHHAFRRLFAQDLDTQTLRDIRLAINTGCAIGSPGPKRGRPAKDYLQPDGVPGNLL